VNYGFLISRKLTEFQEEFPEYTFSGILFATVSRLKLEKGFEKKTLLDITDEQFYTALCKAYVFEKERKD
jgi:hypothetical protein